MDALTFRGTLAAGDGVPLMLRLIKKVPSPWLVPGREPNYIEIARVALEKAWLLLPRWLPRGERRGHEYVALNPRRADKRLGSFSINIRTGRWADFATGDAGGDLIALYAYLKAVPQRQAALELCREVGDDLP